MGNFARVVPRMAMAPWSPWSTVVHRGPPWSPVVPRDSLWLPCVAPARHPTSLVGGVIYGPDFLRAAVASRFDLQICCAKIDLGPSTSFADCPSDKFASREMCGYCPALPRVAVEFVCSVYAFCSFAPTLSCWFGVARRNNIVLFCIVLY